MTQGQVLAFDWGRNIIGILNVKTNRYYAYLHEARMIRAAKKIVSSPGTIVSFNGSRRDLPELAKILDVGSVTELRMCGKHDDMLEITSSIRWPPDPGTKPILGTNLSTTYSHFFGKEFPKRPEYLPEEYDGDELEYVVCNWRDCFMAAALWKKWKRGELTAD